jgi:hypothetical protein
LGGNGAAAPDYLPRANSVDFLKMANAPHPTQRQVVALRIFDEDEYQAAETSSIEQ